MGWLAIADVICLAGLERMALAILQLDVQRSAEAENYVAFRAPVVGDVAGGIFDHADAKLAEIPRLPPGDPGCTGMFRGFHLRPINHGHRCSRHFHRGSISVSRLSRSSRGLGGELLGGGVVMLLAADGAVVFFCGFEKLVAAVGCVDADFFTERLHFRGAHWLEAAGYLQILI
jgi:hypothetical protein